jgi:hypothetical protein
MAWAEPAPVDNYFEAAAVDVELVELELESLDELEDDFSDVEADLSDLSDDELEDSAPPEEPFDEAAVDDELFDASRLSLR